MVKFSHKRVVLRGRSLVASGFKQSPLFRTHNLKCYDNRRKPFQSKGMSLKVIVGSTGLLYRQLIADKNCTARYVAVTTVEECE